MSGMTCKQAELLLETGTRMRQVEHPQTQHPKTETNDVLDRHLRACSSCASLARDLRMVQTALAGLKNAFEKIESPERVKDALLQRLRNPIIDSPAPPPAKAARAVRAMAWWPAVGAASAAMLLLGFTAWYYTSQPRASHGAPASPISDNLGSKDSGSKDSGAEDSGAKDLGAKDLGAKDLGAKNLGAKDLGTKDPRANLPKTFAILPHNGEAAGRKGSHQGAGKTFEMARAAVETPTPNPKVATDSAMSQPEATEPGEEEVRTEFVALQPESAEDSIDGESIVRMKIPASSVGSVGLPVVEDSSHQVTADVVVDQFGNAQAIRFVRPAGPPRHVEGFR